MLRFIASAAVVMLPLTWLSLFGAIARKGNHSHRETDLFITAAETAVFWPALLFGITEILSLFHALTRTGILCAWFALEGVLLLILLPSAEKAAFKSLLLRGRAQWRALDITPRCLLILFLLLCAVNLVCALRIVPCNWDSMTYHLARIIYWKQHRSVAYYDTWIPRQLYSPVLAEYIQLHFLLLGGTDRLANLLQWCSSIGCCVFGYRLLTKMGLSQNCSLFAAISLLSINAFAAESITTQVDLFAAMLLSGIALLGYDLLPPAALQRDRATSFRFFLIGLACGELYIAKTNVCLSAALLLIFLLIARIRRGDRATILASYAGLLLASALLPILPTFARNLCYLGDPLASDYMSGIAVGTWQIRALAINVLKNMAFLCATWHNTALLQAIVNKAALLLSTDINAAAISFNSIPFRVQYSYNMDLASMPTLMLLLLAALLTGPITHIFRPATGNKAAPSDRELPAGNSSAYAAMLILQFFCSLAFIRWQPWVGRLLLPAAVIACFGAVYFLLRRIKQPSRIALLTAAVLLIALSAGEYRNSLRLAGNATDHFSDYYRIRPEAAPDDRQAADMILSLARTPEQVGIISGGDSYQYPLLKLLTDQQIAVENVCFSEDAAGDILLATDHPLTPGFHPRFIIVSDLDIDTGSDRIYYCNGGAYRCLWFGADGQLRSLWELQP